MSIITARWFHGLLTERTCHEHKSNKTEPESTPFTIIFHCLWQFVKVNILGTVLWLLGNLLHLLRSNDFMTYPQHNIRLNNHLRVDAWLSMVAGITLLAFPDYFLYLAVSYQMQTYWQIRSSLYYMYIKGWFVWSWDNTSLIFWWTVRVNKIWGINTSSKFSHRG